MEQCIAHRQYGQARDQGGAHTDILRQAALALGELGALLEQRFASIQVSSSQSVAAHSLGHQTEGGPDRGGLQSHPGPPQRSQPEVLQKQFFQAIQLYFEVHKTDQATAIKARYRLLPAEQNACVTRDMTEQFTSEICFQLIAVYYEGLPCT